MHFPNIYPVINKTVTNLKSYNCYIIEHNETVYLIDTGINTNESWQLLLQTLDENEFSLHDLSFILLTHSHIDHIGLVNKIRKKINVPVYTHSKALPYLKRNENFLKMRVNFFHQLYEEMGCGFQGEKRVQEMEVALEKNKSQTIQGEIRELTDNDKIGGLRVLWTPGHANDHLSFYEPNTGYLFTGDNLFSHIYSSALIEPDDSGNLLPVLQQYENTLLQLKQLFITKIFPGHGHLIKNPYERIDEAIKHIFNKAERIKTELKKKEQTAAEIAQAMYGKLYKTRFPFVMSEVIGHLERLRNLNEVTYYINEGLRYYKLL